jgi:hypothetical protein
VEAFRDLAADDGGEIARTPAPVGKGASGGGPGRVGDMASVAVVLIVLALIC